MNTELHRCNGSRRHAVVLFDSGGQAKAIRDGNPADVGDAAAVHPRDASLGWPYLRPTEYLREGGGVLVLAPAGTVREASAVFSVSLLSGEEDVRLSAQ